MALSKVDFNSINVTPAASKAIKFNSSNNGLETGDVGGNLVLISTQTASSSSTIDFTSGIDSTYKEYVFKFIDIHPATDNVTFGFQANASGGSGFNETMTTTNFRAYHFESGSSGLDYIADNDQAQGTGFQIICGDVGNANDENITGILHLFDPASTTFVKHFLSRFQGNAQSDYSLDMYTAGYFNTTSAIDEIQFKMSSGNIDSGTIKMYGVT
jgi:hypothetical protein